MSHDPNAASHSTPVQASPARLQNLPRSQGLGEDALQAAERVVQAHAARIAAMMQSRMTLQ